MNTDRDKHEDPKQPLQIAADETLPPLAALHATQQAREGAASLPDTGSERYRHSKVEAETRRITEEVTRQAQARARAAQVTSPLQEATATQQTSFDATTLSAPQEVERVEQTMPLSAPTQSTHIEEVLLATPKPLSRILAPLDGDKNGERILPYAAAFATLLHARLIVGHVSPTQTPNSLAQALHLPGSAHLAAQEAFAPQALTYLRHVQERLATHVSQVETLHSTAPTVVEGLVELEKTSLADLVVLALRPHMNGERLSLGRVVDQIIRQGSAPLLVIPPEAETHMMPLTIRHILIPLDGSSMAEEALTLLLRLLAQTLHRAGAPFAVTLLGVAENHVVLPHTQIYLDTISATLRATPYCDNLHVYTKAMIGSAPGAIVGFVEDGAASENDCEEPVDLLIMATHGRSGMSHWLYGSVAEYVLPRVDIPILLLHPRSSVAEH